METILSEIEHALKMRCYYLAVSGSLLVPDICGALESMDGVATPDRYKAWYNANLATEFPWLTDVDCYSLRCGVAHQGRFGHPKMQYARVVFTLGPSHFHNCTANDAFMTDAAGFCSRMIGAARGWFTKVQNEPFVKINLRQLVQYRPMGLAPYVLGAPIIT